MRGELVGVWSEVMREIWIPLMEQESIPDDVFCELFRSISLTLKRQKSVEELADIIDDPLQSRTAFESIQEIEIASERSLVDFFENVHEILEDLGGDSLTNCYFILLSQFVDKYSLRYDLRRPCSLCPTLPGLFATLLRDLRVVSEGDTHLDSMRKDFEDAVRDLKTGCSESRIKTCMQKQVNFIEALGRVYPGVTGTTLGKICDQVDSWPHEKVRDAMKSLYGFASDYPGIRHGGTPASALRAIDMRDMISLSILLAGFTPYLSKHLDADIIYSG